MKVTCFNGNTLLFLPLCVFYFIFYKLPLINHPENINLIKTETYSSQNELPFKEKITNVSSYTDPSYCMNCFLCDIISPLIVYIIFFDGTLTLKKWSQNWWMDKNSELDFGGWLVLKVIIKMMVVEKSCIWVIIYWLI